MGTHQLYALTDAAADHRLRRQDGQDGAGRGVAQRGAAAAPTTSGSTGATPRTPTSARFLKLFTTLPMDEIAQARGACRAPRSTRPRRCWRPRRPPCCTAATRPRPRPRRRRRPSSRARWPQGLPTVEIAAAELAAGLGVLTAFVKAGLVKSNGEARRQIAGGGLRVNDAAVTDEAAKLTARRRARRRHQAVARQEAPRAAEAGVTMPWGQTLQLRRDPRIVRSHGV